MPGLLGEKLGMTQIFAENGKWMPVTVIKAGPCKVIDKRLPDRQGYTAVQIGFGTVNSKKLTRPQRGYFESKKVSPFRFLKEFRTGHIDFYQPGDDLSVTAFEIGDLVDVSGISKGKGFQGVMKRHHFAGGNASHGCSISHRAPGSIGQRTWPGKIFKGKRMAGHMGNRLAKVKNLRIVGIEPEENLLLIRGAVPGANHSLITIYPVGPDFEKRISSKEKKEQPSPKKGEG